MYNKIARNRIPFLLSISKISSMTLLSRIGGFARDMVLANIFGATMFLDAFIIAFKIPNFMRRIFAEGAFSQAFVPIFSEVQKDSAKARLLIQNTAGCLCVVLSILIGLVMLFPKAVVCLFAYGLNDNPQMLALTAKILRCTMPYLGFIALITLYGTVNNCYGFFTATAAVPILLNLSMITGALVSNWFEVKIMSLAYSIPLAGFLQLAMILFFFKGRIERPKPNWQSKKMKELLLAFGLIVGSSVITQLNLIIDTMFASFLPSGSISWLYYSDRLINLPIGLIAVSIATLLLPKLSESIHTQNLQAQQERIAWSLKLTFSGLLPCILVLSLLGIPMITTIYLHGSYSFHDAIMTHRALLAMTIGLPAFMFNKIFLMIFYAHRQLKIPSLIAIASGCMTVILNIILIPHFQHVALALSLSICAWLQLFSYITISVRNGWIHCCWHGILPWIKLTAICTCLSAILLLCVPGIEWWIHAQIFHRFEMFISISVLILCVFLFLLNHFRLMDEILL